MPSCVQLVLVCLKPVYSSSWLSSTCVQLVLIILNLCTGNPNLCRTYTQLCTPYPSVCITPLVLIRVKHIASSATLIRD